MGYTFRSCGAAALIAVILICHGVAAQKAGLEHRQWRTVTSQNFRMHTVLESERAIELLRQLEVMHAALDEPDAAPTYAASVPTVIIAVDDRDDYVSIGATQHTNGIFISTLRENAIVVLDGDGSKGIEVILHEYVHYLNLRRGRVLTPKWYEEGLAEYISASRVVAGEFEFGLRQRGRLNALNFATWLPMSQVIRLTDLSLLSREDAALFYSQSWLLVHYLSSLPDADRHLPQQLQRYSELVGDGHDREQAFKDAFAIPADQLDRLLIDYLQADEFVSRRIPVDTTLPYFDPGVDDMPMPDALIELGEMAVRLNNLESAEQWFTAALLHESSKAEAEAGIGTVNGYRGLIDEAEQRFENAIRIKAWDFRIWMDYAQFWAKRIGTTTDRKQHLFFVRRLEEALRNAHRLSDPTPELNSLQGYAYLAQGKDVTEAIAYLTDAAAESPADQTSRLMLSNAYIINGEYDAAIKVAESVLRFEHEHNAITESAHRLIEEARAQRRLQ